MTQSERVEKARRRRHALRDAMTELEAAASSPVAMEGWLDQLSRSLEGLAKVFEDHVQMVEGDDGLLEEITELAPQLESGMEQMRTDHREIHTFLDNLKTAVKDAATTPDGAGMIRGEVRALVSSLAEHRQRGADLVYDAYNVDISAGD